MPDPQTAVPRRLLEDVRKWAPPGNIMLMQAIDRLAQALADAERPHEEEQMQRCQICAGTRGGVEGNDNRLNGIRVCDYCHADMLRGKPLVVVPDAPGPATRGSQEPRAMIDWEYEKSRCIQGDLPGQIPGPQPSPVIDQAESVGRLRVREMQETKEDTRVDGQPGSRVALPQRRTE